MSTVPNRPEPGVFQPVVLDSRSETAGRPVTVLERAKPRLSDAAAPTLRRGMANLLVIARGGALIVLTLAGTATALIVLCRVWGWLV